ncbi:MAG: nickel/cobalt transporter, partial [Ahrensia sp.]
MRKLVGAGLVLLVTAGVVHAQSSLGVGAAEQPITSIGDSSYLQWIAAQQREFYRSMTDALRSMRDNDAAAWTLIGLSFLYGVLHAAGPGHGKVVISSYMLANETALRRGVMLSLASSIIQALSALVLVGAVFLFLRGTSVSMTDAGRFLEMSSYVLVVAFGGWLLWRKLASLRAQAKPAVTHHHYAHDHGHDHHHHHDHDHDADGVCSSCGHAHMPSPTIAQSVDGFRSGLGAVFSVGLRPCTGAIVVLSFAFFNGLFAAGVASVFAMSMGTAITV